MKDADITIKNNETDDEIKLIYFEQDFDKVIFDGNNMEAMPDGDCELYTDHFTIGFRLLE